MALLAVFLIFCMMALFPRDLLVSQQGQSDWPRGRYSLARTLAFFYFFISSAEYCMMLQSRFPQKAVGV
jgi:hypothetical protein